MRKMLMSFMPEIYQKIHNGVKIFEHRRNFSNEPVKVYMYVSKPVKQITGIVYLNNRHLFLDWQKEFSSDIKALHRIDEYLVSYRYAMEISEFQETSSITLAELKRDLGNFTVPQSYCYLDKKPQLLAYIEKKIKPNGIQIFHNFSDIRSSQICVH